MTNPSELTSEYASAKLIFKAGDEEIVYELPKVQDVMVDVQYEEPEIREYISPITKPPKVLLFSVSMKPNEVDGFLYRITKTNYGVTTVAEKGTHEN